MTELRKQIITDLTTDAEVETNTDQDTNIDGKSGLISLAGLYARLAADKVKIIGADPSTHGLLVMQYDHHEIHEGEHYFMDEVFDLAINNVADIRVTTPNTTKWAHMLINFDTEVEYEYYLYEGVTITVAGTAYVPRNSNRNSGNASGLAIDYITNASVANANADTGVGAATALYHDLIGSGSKLAGSAGAERAEIILKQNTIYDMRLIANAAGYINAHMAWYEHTAKD